ncbi:sigma-54-dependent transcriptional regulator [Polycladidibacter hongkongensis]|uniref:sigma-54-dependent transcriptional regulator n=1 Tax=Polycladidibacter hongkongensis TaxID=1647556 RepID=UPI00082A4E46|nr:sigma-54 dependent transcriptional regulator [Pseudovibrio hongkongensis]
MESGPDDYSSLRIGILVPAPAQCRALERLVCEGFAPNRPPECYMSSGVLHRDLDFRRFDLLFVDSSALQESCALTLLVERCPDTVVIALEENYSISRAMERMRDGAHEVLAQPLDLDRLVSKVLPILKRQKRKLPREGELEECQLRDALLQNTAPIVVDPSPVVSFEGMVGESAVMQRVYEQILRLAAASAPVFISGAPGTGKTLCAKALHQRSRRRGMPFQSLNCGTLPEDMIEAALFGNGSGEGRRKGALELVDGGTLFLDDIGALPSQLQTRLLQLVDTGRAQLCGASEAQAFDIRVICASARSMTDEIAAGRFNEALFYRLHVLPLELPCLKKRGEDISLLARYFLTQHTRKRKEGPLAFSQAALEALQGYTWPGNLRELNNMVQQLSVCHEGPVIDVDVLPEQLLQGQRSSDTAFSSPYSEIEPLWLQEMRIIEQVVERFGGNVSLAASALEISPSTIYRRRQSFQQKQATMPATHHQNISKVLGGLHASP